MKLAGRWRVVLEGDVDTWLARSGRSGLGYLLERLVSGQDVAIEELEYWGIRVRPAEGTVDLAALRALGADDMARALEDCYAELPLADPEAACEFFQHVLDVFAIPRGEDD